MVPPISVEELVGRNPAVDPEKLEEYQRQAAQFRNRQRYKYNLVAPFTGRQTRQQMAECRGPGDNIREPR